MTEDQMLGAVLFAHEEMQETIEVIKAFAAEAEQKTFDWTAPEEDTTLSSLVALTLSAWQLPIASPKLSGTLRSARHYSCGSGSGAGQRRLRCRRHWCGHRQARKDCGT